MDLEEHPLLHFPDLALAVLRAGRNGAATVADAARLLAGKRMQAHEEGGIDAAELVSHLDHACRHLRAAHAIEMLDASRFHTTPRGRGLLSAHPAGVDDGVLMDYPEFRDWLETTHGAAAPEDPRPREFIDGWTTVQRGGDLGDNPFATNTAQHDAWVDGWLEGERHDRE